VALAIGMNTGLFHLMAENDGRAKKASEMAKTLGMDPPLLCKKHGGGAGACS
jgi:hypothetical protein